MSRRKRFNRLSEAKQLAKQLLLHRVWDGLSQSNVADAIGVTFQQIQKYEKGMNGLSALRLKQLANKFKVSLDVLVDPDMITKHRGFTEKMEWQQYEADIERQLTEQEIIDKYKKSVGHYVNNKS